MVLMMRDRYNTMELAGIHDSSPLTGALDLLHPPHKATLTATRITLYSMA